MTNLLLAGCLALILVLVIAVFALPLLIDPNNYKTDIAALIRDKTGRDVAFEGNITVTVFPWIGLRTEKIVVSNKPGFQELPFISVSKSDIKVKLLPLLAQKIEVNTIALDGLTLNLVKDKQGLSNWDDLIASSRPSPSAAPTNRDSQNISPGSALAALTVGDITIQNAQINWNNQQTGKQLELKNIRFTANKFVFGEPIKIDMAMAVSGKELKFPGSIKLVTELRVDEKLDHFDLRDSQLDWISAKKPVAGQPLAAIINTPNADINVAQQTLKLSNLQLQSGDIKLAAEINGEHIMDKPSIQGSAVIAPFNPNVAMKQWELALPTMGDAKALTNLGLNLHFQATADQVEFTSLDVALDNSRGKGAVTIKGFTQPAVLFDLAVDTIDVDRYLPPTKSSKPIASPGMAFAAGTFSVPLDWLRKLDAEGKLALGQLVFNRMTLQDVHLTLSSKKGVVKIGQTAKQFYQGAYSGNLNVDARAEKSVLSLNEKLTNIHLEPLLKAAKGEAKMGGILTASTQLYGQGNNTHELQSNLTGKANFFLKDGFIKGFNLEKMLENSKNLAKGGALSTTQHDQTAFSKISGTVIINKGLLQNNDLIANTEKLRSTGKGNVHLDTGLVDYIITTKLLKAAATATTPEQVHDTPIVIHLGGTLSQPTYTLDMGALLTDKNKAKIDRFLDKNKDKVDKLIDKLDKKLGPGVGDLLKKIF
ncbi:AsmA family protein [Methyloglobulus sp.]|uniref:AsmA family protein n=1 Tax=Methyloglobulus sp. TaxID=2518622 RepID=UPI0032B8185C